MTAGLAGEPHWPEAGGLHPAAGVSKLITQDRLPAGGGDGRQPQGPTPRHIPDKCSQAREHPYLQWGHLRPLSGAVGEGPTEGSSAEGWSGSPEVRGTGHQQRGSIQEIWILGDRGQVRSGQGHGPGRDWGERGSLGCTQGLGVETGLAGETGRGLGSRQAPSVSFGPRASEWWTPSRRGSMSPLRILQTLAAVPWKATQGSPEAGRVCSPLPSVPWAHSCQWSRPLVDSSESDAGYAQGRPVSGWEGCSLCGRQELTRPKERE